MKIRAVLWTAALAALALLGRGPDAAAQTDPQVPPNVQVSRDGATQGADAPVTDFSEVHLAIDPTDPDHLIGSSKFFYAPATYSFYTGVFESFDGGRNWAQEEPPGVEDYALTSDPVNAFDGEGNGYFTLLTRQPTGLDMLKKPAGGAWEEPVHVDRTTNTDKQWIAADQDPDGSSRYAGNLYMSWTAVGSGIVFARSIDSNRSWRPYVTLTTGDVQGSVPAVGPDGTVYVAWGRGVFNGPAPGTLQVTASSNGGVSFLTTVTAADITAIPFFLPNGLPDRNFRSPASLPSFAASPASGALFLAWADYRNGDSDIYLARATDGYRDWTAPIRLNDDPIGNGVDQIHPQISVAPNGRVSVMWMDRRLDCPDDPWIEPENVGKTNFCLTAYMARSFDGGETWRPNFQVGASPWDWSTSLPIASQGDPDTGFIGDYQGLASSNEFDFPFWAGTNDLGSNPEHRQQVWVARVDADIRYEAVPSATPTASATVTGTPGIGPTETGTPEGPPTETGTPQVDPTDTGTPTPTPTRPIETPGSPSATATIRDEFRTPTATPTPEQAGRVLLPSLSNG